MRCALVIALLAAGCSREAPSDCDRAVHHVLFDLTVPKDSPPPDHDRAMQAKIAERTQVLEGIEALTLPVCKREGLTQAQLDCIFAAKVPQDLAALATCPAIVAQRPSWLLVGTPDGPPPAPATQPPASQPPAPQPPAPQTPSSNQR